MDSSTTVRHGTKTMTKVKTRSSTSATLAMVTQTDWPRLSITICCTSSPKNMYAKLANTTFPTHEIGRAHVWTPVTIAQLVCSLPLDKTNNICKHAYII